MKTQTLEFKCPRCRLGTVEEVQADVTLKRGCVEGVGIAHVWVYNSMDHECPEV